MGRVLQYLGNYKAELPLKSVHGKWNVWKKDTNFPARLTFPVRSTATGKAFRYLYEFNRVYGCSCAFTNYTGEEYNLITINIFDFSFVILDFSMSNKTVTDLDCPTSILFFDIL